MNSSFLEVLIIIVPLLGMIAFMTLAERKIMGSMQRRLGPNKVGVFGLLQPISDETIFPSISNKGIFLFAPILSLTLTLTIADISLGIMYVLAISSLGVFGVLFAGSLRSTAQMISYEVVLVFLSNSMNLTLIIESQNSIWYLIPLLPITETNRAPFDLPEAESELVSGFMTEHSALPFAYFFLAEYGSIIFFSTFTSILFLGGYLIPDFGMISPDLMIWLQPFILACYPRLRFDQLMTFCWTVLLPLTLAFFILVPSILIAFNSPINITPN
ncbi:NADH:ubiquinone oxidoreductase [Piptocephalis cylindrospora]|uniref:NADH:ubiquinone oxidoreductase n=1 Tax=Piptocephalis cylindrospora TaxID=1907219 RepID=A0A4P9Y312_9FUNG|nr:NADH:ubiquinone oxidoreductase [Piptocephalis cylindrospora]|eukprot:RKP13245.1 NADH:ubiquinone oxidoreductase [Piptocephalis cylindrospora]